MSEDDSTTGRAATTGEGHDHLCRKCNRLFRCGGDDCAHFHFSTCPDCRRPAVEPDAPPPERPPDEVGEGWPH